MGPDEARQVDATLRRYGIHGVIAPVDPEAPGGEWRVYDQADPQARRDITSDVLAELSRRGLRDAPPASPGPTRGFVI